MASAPRAQRTAVGFVCGNTFNHPTPIVLYSIPIVVEHTVSPHADRTSDCDQSYVCQKTHFLSMPSSLYVRASDLLLNKCMSVLIQVRDHPILTLQAGVLTTPPTRRTCYLLRRLPQPKNLRLLLRVFRTQRRPRTIIVRKMPTEKTVPNL